MHEITRREKTEPVAYLGFQ